MAEGSRPVIYVSRADFEAELRRWFLADDLDDGEVERLYQLWQKRAGDQPFLNGLEDAFIPANRAAEGAAWWEERQKGRVVYPDLPITEVDMAKMWLHCDPLARSPRSRPWCPDIFIGTWRLIGVREDLCNPWDHSWSLPTWSPAPAPRDLILHRDARFEVKGDLRYQGWTWKAHWDRSGFVFYVGPNGESSPHRWPVHFAENGDLKIRSSERPPYLLWRRPDTAPGPSPVTLFTGLILTEPVTRAEFEEQLTRWFLADHLPDREWDRLYERWQEDRKSWYVVANLWQRFAPHHGVRGAAWWEERQQGGSRRTVLPITDADLVKMWFSSAYGEPRPWCPDMLVGRWCLVGVREDDDGEWIPPTYRRELFLRPDGSLEIVPDPRHELGTWAAHRSVDFCLYLREKGFPVLEGATSSKWNISRLEGDEMDVKAFSEKPKVLRWRRAE